MTSGISFQQRLTFLLLSTFLLISHCFAEVPKRTLTVRLKSHVLAVSDLHFSPFYHCHNPYHCDLIKQLKNAPIEEWDKLLSGYLGHELSPYFRDTNQPLLLSAIKALKSQTQKTRIDYAILDGDLLAHYYLRNYISYFGGTKGYNAFVNKTLRYLAMHLKLALPNTTVYISLGNNDSYGGDYYSNPNGQFFKDTAKIYSAFVPKHQQASFEKQFKIAGYYHLQVNRFQDIIVLNSSLFAVHRRGPGVKEAAAQQLEWLNEALKKVKKANRKAIIMMHIPFTINAFKSLKITPSHFYDKASQAAMLKILMAYSKNIVTIFSGHIHADTFFSLDEGKTQLTLNGLPAISPIYSINPSYQVYDINLNTGTVEDHRSFYLRINENNPKWQQAYQFSTGYVSPCTNCSYVEKLKNLMKIDENIERFKTLYHLRSPVGILKNTELGAFICAIYHESRLDYSYCRQHFGRKKLKHLFEQSSPKKPKQ